METHEDKVGLPHSRDTLASFPGHILGYLAMLVCLVVLLAHMPALSARAEFQDDRLYVLDNPLVQNPSWISARRFFTEVFKTSTPTGYYLPLTMTSLMVDKALSGGSGSMRVFHRTSLLFHVANVALVLVLLYRLFGNAWVAAGVALLFGLHPLTVDSVCWLSERKTVLASFFALWSMILYVEYSHREKRGLMAGSAIAYILALLSKPIALPLPVVMLLLDYWPLKRFGWGAFIEKKWLVGLGTAFAVITVVSQNSTAGTTMPGQYGLLKVPLVFCHNLIFYLVKMLCPTDLSPFYYHPYPPALGEPMVQAGLFGTFLLILVLILVWRWMSALLISGLVFVALLLPAMQIISVTTVLVANRYVYLPSLGILIGLAAVATRATQIANARWRTVAVSGVTMVMICFAVSEATVTRRYIGRWQDTVSLYEHMLNVTPGAAPLYVDMGIVLSRQGKSSQAIDCYRKALKAEPYHALGHFNLAVELAKSKQSADEAIGHFQQVLGHNLVGSRAHLCLAVLLKDRGQMGQVLKLMETALRMNPEDFRAHLCLGETQPLAGESREGVYHLREAIRLAPSLAPAVTDLAWLLATNIDPNIRDPNEAVALGSRAVYLAGLMDGKPLDALAAAYAAKSDFDLAVETAEKAVRTADRLKQTELLGKIRKRLELYRQGKPYFEDPARQNNVPGPNTVPQEDCSGTDALTFMEDPNS